MKLIEKLTNVKRMLLLGYEVNLPVGAFNELDALVRNVMIVVSLLTIGVIIRGFYNKNQSFKFIIVFTSVICLAGAIFCLQHEVGFFKTGVFMVILSVLGLLRAWK